MATRRKYRFKSREDAENAYLESERQNHHRVRAMMAMYTNSVRWLEVPKPYKPGAYRFGLFDAESPSGVRLLLIFHPSGQAPSICVYDAHEWSARMIADYARFGPSDDEGRTIQHMAYIVRNEASEMMESLCAA